MVYDWFNRSPEAPQPPEQPSKSEQTIDPATTQDSSAETASVEELSQSELEPAESAQESTDQSADASAEDDPLEWARQAYARLKAQKELEKTTQSVAPESSVSAEPIAVSPEPPASDSAVPASEPDSPKPSAQQQSSAQQQPSAPVAVPVETPVPALSLLEQAAAQRQERQQQLEQASAPVAAEPAKADSVQPQQTADQSDEPSLGEFDETFTWSAEVLAAQGVRADQITLEEIDWLGRLRQGLEKTRQGFVTGLLENLGDDPLSPEVLDDLETLLLRADAGVQATDQVLDALRRRMNEQVVDPTEGIRFLKEQLRDLLDQPTLDSGVKLLAPQRDQLNVWLMVGVNGVGKTTTLGKLANLAVRSGYSAMIAAADTFRAAAVQQVQVWGDRSDVPVIANASSNADPAAVVFDAIGAARAKGTDLVLVDTAGRLQTKHNLMEELEKIRRVVDRLAPEAHVESLLVLDASQGQNGLKQAMAFAKAAGLTGVVITKLDGTARGGVALAVASEAGLPIRFIGAGEGIRDLRPFNSFEFVEALLAGR
ncbi:signal recognition particle-docking protein FtsY [Synechococcus sp. BIOS-E4-1]|uniref:signal recognition particle-docking protein FtsY n=1 Tax=Synechococcus sp. BIOS-E4-1 TaxID=1400864 RepID=UPI0016488456|nr:signal recognition particle-docking protein FtsY [Synechococcus sp. BIOS-E4-1]QNI52598.1 signal recognition particle-docking protein FtsY [Synechococcus sp. BIOS-E4-1]